MSILLNNFIKKYDESFNHVCLLNRDKYNIIKSNPSILFYSKKSCLIINYRTINYFTYFSKYPKYKLNINGWISNNKCVSKNVLGAIQNNTVTNITKEIRLGIDQSYKYSGLEDVILTEWDNSIYLCGTRCDVGNGIGKFCIYKLNDKYEIVESTIVNDELVNNSIEKHWSPIESKPFTFIRWCNPTEIVEIEPVTGKILSIKKLDKSSITNTSKRGNCQTVKYKDGYLSIVHDTRQYISLNSEFSTIYKHYFIQYDNDFNIVRISKPFNFEVDDIEFCCGLQIKNNKVYVSYSIYDAIPTLIEFNENILDKIFNNIEESSSLTVYDINEKGNEFLKLGQLYAAAPLYSRVFTNTLDKQLEYESLMRFCVCILYAKYNGVDAFSDKDINFFIDKLFLLRDNSAEPYYLYAIYYALTGNFDKKEFYLNQSYKYRFELPEIKRYLKIW